MEIQALLGLTLAFLFFSGYLTLLLTCVGAHSVTFTLTNKCSYIVWPGTLTGGGGAQLTSSDFELDTGASTTLDVPATWSGRMFARTQCSTDSTGKFSCCMQGAGAIPPASLVEFTLSGSGGNDFYDVSLVDGFNLPLSITPQGAASCQSTSCPGNVNSVCLPELAVKGPDGSVIACKSACLALNQPQYCCTGAFSTPATCPPTNYSMLFKNQCPQAYSYVYDDKTSTFTCPTGANYLITFCP
ncbi:hypothetical protein ACB092_04G034700 [Castanea dentata]